ncbi:3-deoxy-D-manno-octulosonic acid transferase [Shimia sp.]|uniref:3-deoxy-D-manno-octulosonic acid transferase n=1 Tax=Shimia sp. TaxID=1954381 RepID=UPI00356432F0
MTPAPLTPVLRLYRMLATLAAPLALRMARKRFAARQGPMARFGERNGHASQPRPGGRLIWMHTVSVGEFLSVLDLLHELDAPDLSLLVTTTTSSAADLAARRLPQGVIHQFAPLDTPMAVRRFLDHWRPDLAAFVESEIWPNQIVMAAERGIPAVLLNARLSASSLRAWGRVPATASALLGRFARIMTQSDDTRRALESLGAPAAILETTGDMKAAAAPLPFDAAEAAALHHRIGSRPLWVAASTHDGEEGAVSAAHRQLCAAHPDALLILVPRHPERGDAIEALLRAEGWRLARRSAGAAPTEEQQIYLADTLGETGLWYHLAPLVFVAGSLTPVGGHNPYEPAHFGCAILHGPLHANFKQAYDTLGREEACLGVADANDLGRALRALLDPDHPERLQRLQTNARRYLKSAANNRAAVARTLIAMLR